MLLKFWFISGFLGLFCFVFSLFLFLFCLKLLSRVHHWSLISHFSCIAVPHPRPARLEEGQSLLAIRQVLHWIALAREISALFIRDCLCRWAWMPRITTVLLGLVTQALHEEGARALRVEVITDSGEEGWHFWWLHKTICLSNFSHTIVSFFSFQRLVLEPVGILSCRLVSF